MNRAQMNQTPMEQSPINRAPSAGLRTDRQPTIDRSNTNRSTQGTQDARLRLMHDIQTLCFAKTEAALYLDTHPECKAALDYFYDVCDNIQELTEKYEAEYGPLTHCGVQGNSWTWIDGPWPWQGGCTEKEM